MDGWWVKRNTQESLKKWADHNWEQKWEHYCFSSLLGIVYIKWFLTALEPSAR